MKLYYSMKKTKGNLKIMVREFRNLILLLIINSTIYITLLITICQSFMINNHLNMISIILMSSHFIIHDFLFNSLLLVLLNINNFLIRNFLIL